MNAMMRYNRNDKKGNEYSFDTKSKQEVAADIVNTIIQYQK